MDILDASDASFAAVTQQFNTTTSMGRLTLDILFSFAQFEREITGERIRDKITASKKKGMWTGGPPSLGYDIVHKKLVVNREEADCAHLLSNRYLELGNVTRLKKCNDDVVSNQSSVLIRIRVTMRKRDKRLVFVNSNGYEVTSVERSDTSLLKNVVKAWKWRDALEKEEIGSIRKLSRREGCGEGYIRRIIPLAFLAPDILESILDGNQPPPLDLKNVTAEIIPLNWKAQRKLLGYTG